MFGLILLVKVDMEMPPARRKLDQYRAESKHELGRNSLISALTTSSTSEGGRTGLRELSGVSLSV